MRRQIVAAVLLVAVAAPAHAAPSTLQQKCVNELNKQGAKLAKDQGKASLGCVKDAGRGSLAKLGIPPQMQTAQACLRNDVRGRIARDVETLGLRDATLCLDEPAQRPDFAYTGAAAVESAVRDASIGLVADLFGVDLDAALVSDDLDRPGALCQQEVLLRAHALFDMLWKDALAQKKSVLAGKSRLTGGGAGPVGDAATLGAEIAASVAADAKRRIAKAVDKLHERTARAAPGCPSGRSSPVRVRRRRPPRWPPAPRRGPAPASGRRSPRPTRSPSTAISSTTAPPTAAATRRRWRRTSSIGSATAPMPGRAPASPRSAPATTSGSSSIPPASTMPRSTRCWRSTRASA